jgi:DNA polymerase-3 subunit epsilon
VEIHVGASADAPRRQRTEPLLPRLSEAELSAHQAFVATLGERTLWAEFA